jgi:hypothetical protein
VRQLGFLAVTKDGVDAMAGPTSNFETDPEAERAPDSPPTDQRSVDTLAFASVGLSAMSFVTFFNLSDRRTTPLRAFGYFLMTNAESVTGTVLGVMAVRRADELGRPPRAFLLGAIGAVLGAFTTLLNFNFMRTRRIE